LSDPTEVEMDSLEEEEFKALDHQKRREILRFVGESRGATFTETLNATKTQDSPPSTTTLGTWPPFWSRGVEKYLLSPVGKAAYALLQKPMSTEVSPDSREDLGHHRKQLSMVLRHRRRPSGRG
jgi:hypothetical protein